MRRLRILTWHVHGSYLWYLAHVGHDIYLPVRPGRPEGYGGRPPDSTFPWPDNVHEVAAEQVRAMELDCVLTQSRRNWEHDRSELLSPAQRYIPRSHLDPDPPRESPTATRHFVDDPHTLLVHVTAFNRLMWDNGRTPTRVIEHGVTVPEGALYTGQLARGLVVVNNLARRGRRLGADVFDEVRRVVPLDLVGMGWEECGGVGEVPPREMAAFAAPYRFFFNPIRYTSLGLAVCEAMMIGMPVVGLATTEMTTVVQNGVSGWLDTDPARLVDRMHELLDDPGLARRMGVAARETALRRFSIERFVGDWEAALASVTSP